MRICDCLLRAGSQQLPAQFTELVSVISSMLVICDVLQNIWSLPTLKARRLIVTGDACDIAHCDSGNLMLAQHG
jgi:hypothetical protein